MNVCFVCLCVSLHRNGKLHGRCKAARSLTSRTLLQVHVEWREGGGEVGRRREGDSGKRGKGEREERGETERNGSMNGERWSDRAAVSSKATPTGTVVLNY